MCYGHKLQDSEKYRESDERRKKKEEPDMQNKMTEGNVIRALAAFTVPPDLKRAVSAAL